LIHDSLYFRLLEIIKHHSPKIPQGNVKSIIDRITIIRASNIDDLKKLMEDLEKLIAESSTNLIILDSISFILCENACYSKSYYTKLYHIAETLNYISKYYNLPILITNQVTRKDRSSYYNNPFLSGYLWFYCPNVRLKTDFSDDEIFKYQMSVTKNSLFGEIKFNYLINSSGLEAESSSSN
jgi:hypothetical protein